MGEDFAERLEMLLVLQWLDEGSPLDGTVALSVPTAAAELGRGGEREGLLAIMSALGTLEERGSVRVAWPAGVRGDPRVTLAEHLRKDAARLFGTGP